MAYKNMHLQKPEDDWGCISEECVIAFMMRGYSADTILLSIAASSSALTAPSPLKSPISAPCFRVSVGAEPRLDEHSCRKQHDKRHSHGRNP